MTFSEFCLAARQYAMMTGASVTSWGRTYKHNTDVGGVAYSAHRFWLACDFVYDEPGHEPERIALARRLGLKLLPEGDHHHAQPLDWTAG